MKRSWFVAAASTTLGLAAGCQSLPEPVCESTLLVPIRTVSGPRQLTLGQTATYNLAYMVGTSCGQFNSLVTNTIDSLAVTGATTQQVAVQARYVGCSCATDTLTRAQTTYQFRPSRAGTYLVQFLTRQSAFITDTLTVR